MEDRSARTWIWASLILQFFGYVFDAVWHGLLSPGVEPTTVGEMVRHLGTVHLPLYIGAASVLVAPASGPTIGDWQRDDGRVCRSGAVCRRRGLARVLSSPPGHAQRSHCGGTVRHRILRGRHRDGGVQRTLATSHRGCDQRTSRRMIRGTRRHHARRTTIISSISVKPR